MARVWGTGFEVGSLQVMDSSNNVLISSAQARTGTYSAAIGPGSPANMSKLLPANYTELYIRIGLYASGARSFLQVVSSQAVLNLTIQIDPGTQVMTANLGNWNGNLLGTGGIIITYNVWHCIEIRIKMGNPGGIIQTKVDGTPDISYAGNTIWAGIADIRTLSFGGNPLPIAGYIDDIAVNDTSGSLNNSWIGQGGIEWIPITAGTSQADLTPSLAPNFSCVNERPPDDDTTYVESAVVDDFDVYAVTPISIVGTVSAAYWYGRAKLTGVGAGNIARVIRSGGTDYDGADQALTGTYAYKQEVLETDPATPGVLWTMSGINHAGPGVKVR